MNLIPQKVNWRIDKDNKIDLLTENQNVKRACSSWINISPEALKVLEDAKAIAEEWVTNLRLEHVLQKFPADVNMESMGDVIKAMIEDVYREGREEIVESKEASKAIGQKTVQLFKQKLQSKLK